MQGIVSGGIPFVKQTISGGIDSVYGIGQTNTSRFINTFPLKVKNQEKADKLQAVLDGSGGLTRLILLQAINAAKKPQLSLVQKYSPFQRGGPGGTFTTRLKKPDSTYGGDLSEAKAKSFGDPGSLGESGYGNDVNGVLNPPDYDPSKATFIELIDGVNKAGENKEILLKSNGNTPGINNDIADYNMLTYGKIQELAKEKKDNGTTQDFRTKHGVGNKRGVLNANDDYATKNIESPSVFGFGNPGKMVNANTTGAHPLRTDQFGVDFSKLADFKGHYDEVQVKKIGEADDKLDIVPLIFQLGTDNSRLQFRGTISGLTENFSPSYNEIKYSGRAEPVYVYDSFKRDISFNFKVYATSRVEMQPLWTKLERLSTYTMPRYATTGYTSPGNDATDSFLKLTIGKLYVKTPMILTTLGYTYSDETAWDIDFGTPMGIDISVGCTILGNDLHQYDSEKVFVFDGNAAAATGTFRVK